jgi:hypothetical protein
MKRGIFYPMHLIGEVVGNVIFKKYIVRTRIFAFGDDSDIVTETFDVGDAVNRTVFFVLCDSVSHKLPAVRFQNG